MPLYTHTNPYQPNGYTPIQYGTGIGVQGNTFMTNFPYQDNGYAPITTGVGTPPSPYTIGPTQDGLVAPPSPYTPGPTQEGTGPGPSNEYFNTLRYEDNIGTQILKPGIGPDNPYNNVFSYAKDGIPDPPIGTTEYVDWIASRKLEPYYFNPILETIYRSPNYILLSEEYPNAGTFYNFNSKDGIADSENDLSLETVARTVGLGLASGLTSNTAVAGLIGGPTKHSNSYKLLEKKNIEKISKSFLPYYDYRREIGTLGLDTRLDGTAAAIRSGLSGKFNYTATAYAAASLLPGGAYSIFNLESIYGFGSNAGFNPQAKKDFTLKSNVASKWTAGVGTNRGGFTKAIGPELAIQFRGDKVNVIDFGSKKLSSIYKWQPPLNLGSSDIGGKLQDALDIVSNTRDFIKFYFTGPKLTANPANDIADDVLVFRAIITSLTDNFNASWNPIKYIGRADPNYTYQGFGRQLDINFTVYASDRDEMKPMYRKLNYLASYTAPSYSDDSLTMEAPWMRITIGDLLVHQPVVLTSCYYTFMDSDTTWETNLVRDPTMMEVPFKVEVNLQFNVITDYLPQKGGRMYTLAKQFKADGTPKEGNDNWLSDAIAQKATPKPTADNGPAADGAGTGGEDLSINSYVRAINGALDNIDNLTNSNNGIS